MRNLKLLSILLFLIGNGIKAQIASSDCISELRPVYAAIDHQRLFAQDSLWEMDVKHSYIMRTDPEGKTFEFDEKIYFGKQFYFQETSEFIAGSDESEAFRFQRFQFTVYRMKSNLEKMALLPGIDKGILEFCTVVQCDFIPIEGVKDHRHKHALLKLNPEGQKKYQATQIEFVWDPITKLPIEVAVDYTDKPTTKWVKYEFKKIKTVQDQMVTKVKDILMDANGEMNQPYSGSEVVDYR